MIFIKIYEKQQQKATMQKRNGSVMDTFICLKAYLLQF